MTAGVAPDPADEAMVARAHERFAAERRRARRSHRAGALPNLIVIGGLKCGTTSLHHYLNLHPQIEMSRPKELNFFVSELNWELGRDWYASHFSGRSPVRGETSPHYTNLPRFDGVAERMRGVLGSDVRLVYMVRDPIDRMLSHYLHNVGGGYETRPLEQVLTDPEAGYVARSRYAMQLEPYLREFGSERAAIVSREELKDDRAGTMRRVFSFLGVDSSFSSEQFEREWETGSAKSTGGFRLMDRAVRLPGLRALDRNFDRLPERLRWLVERLIHDPGSGAAAKPELSQELRARLEDLFHDDVGRLEGIAERPFGWLDAES
jgi:Sulfotransferase domain